MIGKRPSYVAGEVVSTVVGAYSAGKIASFAWKLMKVGQGAAGRIKLGKLIRIELGNVHFIPGINRAWNKLRLLYLHLLPETAVGKLHLPYQIWPWVAGARAASKIRIGPGSGVRNPLESWPPRREI